MKARWLIGAPPTGRWKAQKDVVRPNKQRTMDCRDMQYLQAEIQAMGAKSLLEFGPGDTTQTFADMGLLVTTIEHMQQWYEVALERFKDRPNVRVLKGEDEMPFTVEGMGSYERFDVGFVDAPQGYFPILKRHKDHEDCNRFNTALFALQRCKVVFLHDVNRALERGTCNRLHLLGYKIEFIQTPYGIARICPQPEQTLSTEPSETLGSSPKESQPTQTPLRRLAPYLMGWSQS